MTRRGGFAGAWIPPIGWCLLVFALSAVPYRSESENIPGADKAVHFVEYAVLGFLVARALRITAPERPRRRSFAIAAGLAAAYGLTDEVHQLFVPDRAFEWGDLAADAAGAALGAAIRVFAFAGASVSGDPAPGAPLPPTGSPPGP